MSQPVKKDCIASMNLLRGFQYEHIINLSGLIEASSRAIVQFIKIYQNWFLAASSLKQLFLMEDHDCDQIMDKILNQTLPDFDQEDFSSQNS